MAIVEGHTKTQAFKISHPKVENWEKNTVWTEAWRFSKLPEVITRLEKLKNEHYERHRLTIDNLIEQVRRMAFFDIGDLFDDQGNLKSIDEMGQICSSVLGVKIISNKDGIPTISFEFRSADRLKAIYMLGQALPFWNKDRSLPMGSMFSAKPGDELPAGDTDNLVPETINERDLARRIALLLTHEEYKKPIN